MVDPPRPMVPTREGYDRWATVYDDDANPLTILESEVLGPKLRNVAGLRVADIGCGTGRHAIELTRRGAKVTALDFSEGMLEKAKAKPGAENVNFVVCDFARPLPLKDRAFDIVLNCLVLDHIADVGLLFREFARVCAHDGVIHITIMHPALLLRGSQAAFTDPDTDTKTLVESVPNQISDYINAAAQAGLAIRSASEHAGTDELAKVASRAEKYVGWPLLLVLELAPHH